MLDTNIDVEEPEFNCWADKAYAEVGIMFISYGKTTRREEVLKDINFVLNQVKANVGLLTVQGIFLRHNWIPDFMTLPAGT